MTVGYADPTREAAFSVYVTPKPRIASVFLLCLIPINVYFDYTIQARSPDFSTSVDGALLLFNALALLVALFGMVVFAVHRRSRDLDTQKRALLSWLHDCNWAVFCAAGYVQARVQFAETLSKRCENDVFLYQQTTSRAFADFNCWRRFQANSGAMILVVCVILDVKFRQCAVAAIVGVFVCTPICLAIWPRTHVELAIGEFIFTLALTAFIAFARYQMEKDQRRAFEVHEALGRHLEDMQSLSTELEGLVERLLPRGIIARSSSATLRAKLKERDVSHEAIAVVMKVADFEGVSTQMLQGRVAIAIESAMRRLSIILPDCGLERVSVLLDEFIAVGNLLEPINMRKSLIGTCSAAMRLAGIETADSLPLVFGIDVGTAVGEFIGSADFMRYDVRGPVINTARSLTMVAKSGEVLLSNVVAELISDAVAVRDGPALFDASASITDGSVSSDQAYAPSQKELSNGSNTCVVLTGMSESAVQLVAHEAIMAASSSLLDGTNSNKTASSEDDTLLVAKVARLQEDVECFESLESELTRNCGLYWRFIDETVEQEYLVWRMVANVNRGQRTWLVYAWVVLAFAVVLFLDMDEVRGPYGLILFMVASFASIAASQMPSRLQHMDIASWFHWWSFLTLMIPLVVITAMGISRPSAIGSDVRTMLFAGTIARVTSFAHARHELFVTPILVLLSHLQYLAPGGSVQVPTVLHYLGVMAFVIGNASVDYAQRLAFSASRRLEKATAFVEMEQELRLGLLQSCIPAPVFDAWQNNCTPEGVLLVPDSHVIAVSRVAASSRTKKVLPSELPRAEDFDSALREALRGLSHFHICSVSGDRALVMAGVCTSTDGTKLFAEKVKSSGNELLSQMLCFCSRVAANGPYRCIGDIDTTVQAINPTNSFVAFAVYGVAAARTLAIDAAAGEAVGVLITSRVTTFLSGTTDLHMQMTTESLPTWRVRGVGQFQLTRVTKCSAP